MENPEQLNSILELIRNEYENGILDLEQLKLIVELCESFISNEEIKTQRYKQYQSLFNKDKDNLSFVFYDLDHFKYPDDSDPFPPGSPLPIDFIGEFKDNFQDKYELTSHIYSEVADELFDNNEGKILIHLAQTRNEILLCIKKNDDEYYQINDVDALVKIDTDWVRNFERGLGNELDEYLRSRRPDKPRNTRKFEITRNVYEYLKDKGYESIILFPAICMDDDMNNPSKESYKHRYTYMMTFGKKNLDFRVFADIMIFDRNGLCPPGC